MSNTTKKETEYLSNVLTLSNLDKKWAAKKKWNIQHPLRAKIKDCYDFFRYTIPRVINDWKYEIKWGFQRMFRGYDDPYVWDYWSENARLTIKALQHLQKHKVGFPCMLLNKNEKYNSNSKNDQKKYEKRWNDILDKMINGWKALLKIDTICYKTKNGKYDFEKSHMKQKELLTVWEKSMIVYIKYYQNLWD